ncbi:hypothetical protein [Sodalis endosymbiont of Henestaris halophilus]|uniref:hypothetical protein n=1 Tax=Sodalis endosymbiont of Henestaris halophilus TaxID=1929246 RepID=UPI000BC0473D|nr:hypothetical protein [Sodalis endosymbiont of Henestaris halophilus]SNC58649.1 hypothetical protein HBA_0393 [Sodalis endosymbiont of Henestaris halophilus]
MRGLNKLVKRNALKGRERQIWQNLRRLLRYSTIFIFATAIDITGKNPLLLVVINLTKGSFLEELRAEDVFRLWRSNFIIDKVLLG